jgi:molecular chaperone GrpE (heat shock protein)
VARLADGTHRVISIAEVAGIDGDVVTTSEIFELKRRGMTDNEVATDTSGAPELEHRLASLERENQRNADRTRGMSMAMLAFIEALDEAEQAARAANDASIERSMVSLSKRAQWFIDALGLSPIEPKSGDAFDESLHEAVRTVPPNGVPRGRIVAVTQRGFRAEGRIARRAQVVIAG